MKLNPYSRSALEKSTWLLACFKVHQESKEVLPGDRDGSARIAQNYARCLILQRFKILHRRCAKSMKPTLTQPATFAA